jgi:small subunit ribosomal protein S17
MTGTAMSQSTERPATPQAPDRRRRKTEIGTVTSDKMNKTRRVEVETLFPHPKYGKLMRRRTVCHAHDETNESHVGDIVEIMETRPLSKLKRWRMVRIVRPGAQQALAGEGETAKAAPETTPG